MNSRGESLYLPDDLAVQRAGKVGYNKGWNDRKFQDLNIIEDALREISDFQEFSRVLREKMTELDRNVSALYLSVRDVSSLPLYRLTAPKTLIPLRLGSWYTTGYDPGIIMHHFP